MATIDAGLGDLVLEDVAVEDVSVEDVVLDVPPAVASAGEAIRDGWRALRADLVAQAYLFDDPDAYAAGVDDALRALLHTNDAVRRRSARRDDPAVPRRRHRS